MRSGRMPSRAVSVALGLSILSVGMGGAVAIGRAPAPPRHPSSEVRSSAGDGTTTVVGTAHEVDTHPRPPTTRPPAAPPTTLKFPGTSSTTGPRTTPTRPGPNTTEVTGPTLPTAVPDALTPGIYVMRPDGSQVVRVTTGSPLFSWSPDGSRIAVERDGVLVVATANGSGERVLAAAGAGVLAPFWSPDGARIAFGRSGGGLYVVSADGSGAATLVDVNASYAAWAPDGRLSAARPNGELVVYELDGTARVLATDAFGSVAPAWSPDGSRVAYLGNRIAVVAADGTGGHPVTAACCGSEYVLSPLAWSPDGRRLAFIDQGDVRAVGVDGGAVTTLVPEAVGPAWSPDGLELAFIDQSITRADTLLNMEVGVAGAGGADRRVVLSLPASLAANSVSWNRAGNRIAVAVLPRSRTMPRP